MKTYKNILADDLPKLKKGDKVSFIWYGNKDPYVGRIEMHYSTPYFVNEFNYEGDEIKPHYEGMRYYNSLNSFFKFVEFNILEA